MVKADRRVDQIFAPAAQEAAGCPVGKAVDRFRGKGMRMKDSVEMDAAGMAAADAAVMATAGVAAMATADAVVMATAGVAAMVTAGVAAMDAVGATVTATADATAMGVAATAADAGATNGSRPRPTARTPFRWARSRWICDLWNS